jgi:hypothetical protein
MLKHFYKNSRYFCSFLIEPKKTDIVVVGGGAVGLTLSTFLSKYNVKHFVLEKEEKLDDHPKAHYLSPRTVEIFQNLRIFDKINMDNAKIEKWNYYRFCSYILDKNSYLGEINHLGNRILYFYLNKKRGR